MAKRISSWSGYGFMERGVQIPRSQQLMDAPNEYRCVLSPYVSDENKDALIHSIMRQFQDIGLYPQIMATQGNSYFIVTFPKDSINQSDAKKILSNNYLIEKVTTPVDAVVRRNYHMQIPGTSHASVNGQGYDAPVTSYLDAPGANDPEGAQYIIDQANITGPQIEASIKEAVPYHVSPSRNYEDIVSQGLDPRAESHIWDPTAPWRTKMDMNVYLLPTDEDANDWAKLIQLAEYNEGNESKDFDLYHVDTEGLEGIQKGMTDIGKEELVSKTPIPPERITHIKRFDPWKEAYVRQAHSPDLNPLPEHVEDVSQHRAIEAYLKWKYNWNEMDRFGKVYSDYSSGDVNKNLSIMHGFTSDAWGDVCTCPMCSFANKVPSGPCSGAGCDHVYDKEKGDRLYLLRPGTNVIKKNVWKYNPDENTYLCPDCKVSAQKISMRNKEDREYDAWDDLEDDPELKLHEPSRQWYENWQDVPESELSSAIEQQQGKFKGEQILSDVLKDSMNKRTQEYLESYPDHISSNEFAQKLNMKKPTFNVYLNKGKIPQPDIKPENSYMPFLWHKDTVDNYLKDRN